MTGAERETVGRELIDLVRELYPICRSITGDGVRETLRLVARKLPLELHEVPSGTPVLDWTVPDEWNAIDAWVKNLAGERVVDHPGGLASAEEPRRRAHGRPGYRAPPPAGSLGPGVPGAGVVPGASGGSPSPSRSCG